MRIDVECNNVYIFAEDVDRTRGKYTDKLDRQKKQANKTSKTDNHFNQQRNRSETGGGGRRDVNHFEKGRGIFINWC